MHKRECYEIYINFFIFKNEIITDCSMNGKKKLVTDELGIQKRVQPWEDPFLKML